MAPGSDLQSDPFNKYLLSPHSVPPSLLDIEDGVMYKINMSAIFPHPIAKGKLQFN